MEKARLLDMLQPVALPLRSELFVAGETPRFVHFLTSGMSSLVAEMSAGGRVEVGFAGRECLPESLYLLGPAPTQARAFMQAQGTALRMDFEQFREEFLRSESIRRQVLRHVQYQGLMTAQLAACNRLHSVEERLSRWLLMVSVRLGANEMYLTQEFLSIMLGSRRATVTIAAGTLQRAGLIEYRRGNVKIIDRERLQQTTCECFSATERLFEKIYK